MSPLYIIAGPNGAGKTTASMTILPEILNCREFVNADEIAKGLSPFQPETVSFEAGRIMLNRIYHLISTGDTFAFETTLSTLSYQSLITFAKNHGYKIHLLFFYLNSIDLAKERVAKRVLKGGHSIPEEVIIRRYTRGLENFFSRFINICDTWSFYNNSFDQPKLVATKSDNEPEIVDIPEWFKLASKYGRNQKI
ncbi:MAG TPA: zeta toxin family protein [Chitinophagales bacterium]|nr:zeta toxin family protein [Chitinophagales bacterium]